MMIPLTCPFQQTYPSNMIFCGHPPHSYRMPHLLSLSFHFSFHYPFVREHYHTPNCSRFSILLSLRFSIGRLSRTTIPTNSTLLPTPYGDDDGRKPEIYPSHPVSWRSIENSLIRSNQGFGAAKLLQPTEGAAVTGIGIVIGASNSEISFIVVTFPLLYTF